MPAQLPTRTRGVSPVFSVSAEDMRETKVSLTAGADQGDAVNPPSVGPGAAVSEAMNLIQPWQSWNFSHVAEPKFDGICQHVGTISNRPDFISEHHMIGLLRNIDDALRPGYSAFMRSETNMPRPARPPVGRG